MTKNKILVFFPYKCNINMGGPAGFIAHNLLDKPREFFSLTQDFPAPTKSIWNKIIHYLKSRIEKFRNRKDIYIKEELNFTMWNNCNANSYKYIFFHDCETLYACRNLIKKNKLLSCNLIHLNYHHKNMQAQLKTI